MTLTLLTIGRPRTSWIIEGCAEYARRIGHSVKFTIVELPTSKAREPSKQMAEESSRMLRSLEKYHDSDVWLLDALGERRTSMQFAELFKKAHDSGRSLLFLLGGAYGVDDSLRSAVGKRILRLSDMTLPHELCRLLFLEQVYRAGEILGGRGYHH